VKSEDLKMERKYLLSTYAGRGKGREKVKRNKGGEVNLAPRDCLHIQPYVTGHL
jgi:hypothetical protein